MQEINTALLRKELEICSWYSLFTRCYITNNIHKSLQGKVKTKIIGPGALVKEILKNLEQFYGDQRAAVGDKLLPQVYNFHHQESKEESAFTSCLDNQICQAKKNDAELLPSEEAVDHHLRLFFGRDSMNPLRIRPDTKRIPAKHSWQKRNQLDLWYAGLNCHN